MVWPLAAVGCLLCLKQAAGACAAAPLAAHGHDVNGSCHVQQAPGLRTCMQPRLRRSVLNSCPPARAARQCYTSTLSLSRAASSQMLSACGLHNLQHTAALVGADGLAQTPVGAHRGHRPPGASTARTSSPLARYTQDANASQTLNFTILWVHTRKVVIARAVNVGVAAAIAAHCMWVESFGQRQSMHAQQGPAQNALCTPCKLLCEQEGSLKIQQSQIQVKQWGCALPRGW